MSTVSFGSQTIERGQRLSRSLLWGLQRTFYEQQGVQAWNMATVPHYITNNPVIAAAYARLVLAYLGDCCAAGLLNLNEPVYLLELGAGTGRLAFSILQDLLALLEHSELNGLHLVYLLSDLPERNLEFWKRHPRLAPFVSAAQLDFARYDVTRDDQVRLEVSGACLEPGQLRNPLVVLANYLFDSIPQDVFFINSGLLCEGLTTLVDSAPGSHSDLLPRLRVRYEPRYTNPAYYDDPLFNQVLNAYPRQVGQGYLQIPIGAFEALGRLRALSADRLLLIASDRGFYQPELLRDQPEPKIFLHGGCFSMQMNFHALGQYTHFAGGHAWMSQHRTDGLVTAAFAFGLPDAEAGRTAQAFDAAIAHGGPDDFFQLKKAIEPLLGGFTLAQLLALLSFSRYDSNMFEKCCPTLLARLPGADFQQQSLLGEVAARVWERYYPIGEAFDMGLALGQIFISLSRYPQALECLLFSQREYSSPQCAALIEECLGHIWEETD